ncbi:aryl-sulfate sulfotransferase, partial [Levilactobacillus parabrevis]
MKKHRRFGWLIGAAFVVLALTGCAQSSKADAPKQPKRVTDATLLSTAKIKSNIGSDLVSTLKDQQASTTQDLRDKLNSGDYSADHMYVKLNPYGTSPLSAIALFTTDDAVKVSYTVVGKTDKTSVTNTLAGYKTRHTLPIVGLYADDNNTVKIHLTTKAGKVTTKTIYIQTKALAKNLANLKLTVTKNDKTKMKIGNNQMTFMIRSTQRPFAVDADGAVRWYSDNYAQHIYKQLSNGHIILMNKKDNAHMVYNDLIETDYLGRVYKQYHISNKTKST